MKFVPASDRSLLIVLGEGISVEINARVHVLSRQLMYVPGVTSLSPAYASLLVRFDPLLMTHEQLETLAAAIPLDEIGVAQSHVIEIPVRYDGPDLEEVAERHSLSAAAVIEAHASVAYHAYFAGFVPGFVYLGEVPAAIATPRRATPRKEVPSGSVAIAGTQTGVYPRSTPGGWNLIGRTDAVMFDAAQGRALVEPGDRVRFIPL
ncbi:MAG TPA: 5-oxoprolinase subunit PxpB [Bryobacteraceae bacterium]|jgi:KipI family sensor histidine kinase inhibitor